MSHASIWGHYGDIQPAAARGMKMTIFHRHMKLGCAQPSAAWTQRGVITQRPYWATAMSWL